MTQQSPAQMMRYMTLASRAGASTLVLGAVFLTYALVAPLPVPGTASAKAPAPVDLPRRGVNTEALLALSAGRDLVRPSQVVAAVKDNGTAAKLLAQLKLTGLTAEGDRPTAYITIDKIGFQTVHVGDRVLEFHVDEISPKGVRLSLDGVVVTLGY
jgi:hypothetical protein